MKQLFVLLLVFNLGAFAEIRAQQVASYRVKNADLKSCIRRVEQLTGLGFLYNGRELEQVKGISLDMEDAEVSEILERLLENTGSSMN